MPGWSPGLDLDLLLAVERLDRPGRPEHGFREPEVELADEIEAVAHEALVGPHVHAHVESPAGAPSSPAWPCPVMRTAWPSSMPAGMSTPIARRRGRRPRPRQSGQGPPGSFPRPAQRLHGAVRTSCPSGERTICRTAPAPLALAAGQYLRSLRGAIALAHLAGAHELEVEVDVHAGRGVGEVDVDRRLRIGAGLRAGRAGEAAAEERAEQVVQEREVHEALGVEALSGDGLVPVAVVARPPVLVGEHLVGLCDLAEALLGVRRLGDVRMQLPGQPAEGLLDLAVACVAADAEQLVVVLLRHMDLEFYFL